MPTFPPYRLSLVLAIWLFFWQSLGFCATVLGLPIWAFVLIGIGAIYLVHHRWTGVIYSWISEGDQDRRGASDSSSVR